MLTEGGRARRYPRLFRLGMEHARIIRSTAEQRARIQADALDATPLQQAIEQALFLTLGEECTVAHFDGDRHIDFVQKGDQLCYPRRAECGRQLQPIGRHPCTQRLEQVNEGLRRGQLLAQVTAVADIAGELGGESKVRGHHLRPALDSRRRRSGIKGGVAFYRIEDLAVEAEKLAGFRIRRVQVFAPGVFTPGRTTEKIGKRGQTHPSNVQVQPQHFHLPVDKTCGGQVAGQGLGGAFVARPGKDHVLLTRR
ncbi:hypothetical protein D9M71_451640 [compost metagenome]